MDVSRRHFCAAVGTATFSAFALSCTAPAPHAGPTSTTKPQPALTVIAYNVQAATGWPAERKRAKAALAAGKMPELIAAELAKYSPDIINFSESPTDAVTKEIARHLGMNYVRFPSAASWPGTILSRGNIFEPQNVPLRFERPKDLFTRHWGRATTVLPLPSSESIIVHSAHLYPFADPTRRLQEIHAMLGVMQDDFKAGRSMILMGDLNHEPNSEEYRLWTSSGWADTFAKVGKGDGFTRDADAPKKRIDYVMAAGPLAAHILESRPLFEGAFRLDLADPEAFSLSDHVPQLARFGPRT